MHLLVQANERSEWMWSMYRKLVLYFLTSVLILPFNSALLCWFLDGELIVDHFFRPAKMMLVIYSALVSSSLLNDFNSEIFFHDFQITMEPINRFGVFWRTDV